MVRRKAIEMADGLVGAWESVAEGRVGLLLFTESHYGWAMAHSKRDLPKDSAEPTTSEAVGLFNAFTAHTGSYRAADGVLSVTRSISTIDHLNGVETPTEYSIDGDQLKWGGERPDGGRFDLAFRRLEPLGEGPLVGAWKMTGGSGTEGMALYTAGHFVALFHLTQAPARSVPLSELSDQEIAERWRTRGNSLAGSYSFKGDAFTQRHIVARDPRSTDRESSWDWDLTGDRGTVRLVSPPTTGGVGRGIEVSYQRL